MDDPKQSPREHARKPEHDAANEARRVGVPQDDASSPPTSPVPSEDAGADASHRLGSALDMLDRLHSAVPYGDSTLRLMCGLPKRADACLLPDGTRTDARVVYLPPGSRAAPDVEGNAKGNASDSVDPSACVWQRAIEGSQLARRGRVVIDPEAGLRFVDDPDVGDDWGEDAERPPSLERDLASSPRIMELCRSDVFATLLYAALCNTTWRHKDTGAEWHCSWRYAGGVLAHVRGEGDYLDWYCNGGEGMVDERVLAEIEALGWTLVPEAPTNDPDEW